MPSPFGPRTCGRGRAPRPLSEVHTAGAFDQRFGLLPEPSRILLPVHHAPELRWAHAGVTPEGRDEVRQRVEPGPMADLRHAEGRLAQQVRRVVDPEPDQVPVRGNAVALLEDACEVEGGQGRGASDSVHVEVLRQVGFEVGADLVGMLTNEPTLVVAVAEDPEQPLTPPLAQVYAGKGSLGLADSCSIVAPCLGHRRQAGATWLLLRWSDAQGSRHERRLGRRSR